jgi:acetyl esterase/lipase
MLTARPSYDPTATFEIEEEDVEYRRDGAASFVVRLYRPKGAGPFPTLLDVHGGAWSGGTRESDAPMSRALARSGVLVAAIDFRLAPAHPYPASMQDLNYGLRWLKARAAELGGSGRRVGALGSSSGGHMAVLAALRPRDGRYGAIPLERPAGRDGAGEPDASLAYVVACWPVLDPHARYLHARQAGRPELVEKSEGYFGDEATMREASPTLILERGEAVATPPTLVVAGTADGNVPNEIVDRFVAAYRARGGWVELARYDGAPHGFGNRPGPDAEHAIATIKRFVAGQIGA